jgi:hypothetical protein
MQRTSIPGRYSTRWVTPIFPTWRALFCACYIHAGRRGHPASTYCLAHGSDAASFHMGSITHPMGIYILGATYILPFAFPYGTPHLPALPSCLPLSPSSAPSATTKSSVSTSCYTSVSGTCSLRLPVDPYVTVLYCTWLAHNISGMLEVNQSPLEAGIRYTAWKLVRYNVQSGGMAA